MRISEIARAQPPQTRRVGIRFTEHAHVMQTAIRIWRRFGLDVEIDQYELHIDQPRERAADTMGMIERYTGRVAYNDWERNT